MKEQYSSEKYQACKKEKKCKHCDNLFIGTTKQISCSKECTRKAKLAGMEVHHHITQCNVCNDIIKDLIKYGTKTKDKLILKKCNKCCAKSRTEWYLTRLRKRLDSKKTNSDFIEKKLKNGKIWLVNLEKEKRLSERMKNDNPMKDGNTVDKARNTILNKIEKGEIEYKKGSEHHLWKGNRSNNNYIRTCLKKWRKEIQKLYSWRCQICHSNTKLEIHHTEPLRHIIDKFTNKPLSQYQQESLEFQTLCEVIVNYHFNNMEVGQLVCEKCHGTIDEFRRQTIKNENKTNN